MTLSEAIDMAIGINHIEPQSQKRLKRQAEKNINSMYKNKEPQEVIFIFIGIIIGSLIAFTWSIAKILAVSLIYGTLWIICYPLIYIGLINWFD